MLKFKFVVFIFILNISLVFAQDKFTLSGIISDNSSNETIIGANVIISDLNVGTTTNEYGFYSITLPKGKHKVLISYLGFESVSQDINLTSNEKLNIALTEQAEQLEEIVVSDQKTAANIKGTEMSVSKLSIKNVKKLPAILGESDVLKTILQLPGVTNAGEGASGFNVRGGGADQNLILLDEAVVYNSSHVFGFFSVFNSDVIKDLKLYKGGIPARFGGRGSSVLEIYQKDGNSKEFHANGGIGLISSRLLLEGPIVNDRTSFLVAGRGSYAHLFLKLSDNKNSAYFYDINAKITHKINENNNLYVSGYFGRDIFALDNFVFNKYGNSMLNVRWNHLYSDKLFSNLSAIYSNYYYGIQLDFLNFDWESGIKNYNVKYDFKKYVSNNFKLGFGSNSIYYDFNPGVISPLPGTSTINQKQLDKKYAFEQAFYLEADHQVSNKIALTYGLRYSMFYRLGKENISVYNNNQSVEYNNQTQVYSEGNAIGVKSYKSNAVIDFFNNFEPRLGISYALNDITSLKASYNRMSQYIILVSNTTSPAPVDIWTPSGNGLKPLLVDQVAFGFFKNLSKEKYSIEVETYYKKTQNSVDYIDGAQLIANNNVERILLKGEGRAYGLEFLFKKNLGDLTGWVSYTISRTEQRTAGRTPEEVGINNGDWYKNGYDKLHNLNTSLVYDFSKKWNLGVNFVLQSGRPVTFPNGQYSFSPVSSQDTPINVPLYSSRNQDNLPAFHHLDFALTYVPTPKKDKRWKKEWVFSIYNVYNRKNAASINFNQNLQTGMNEATRLSIFGIVPSITYNFTF